MKLSAIFAPIERLIEEHGSAAIQGKHIAFLREQLSLLKEQAALLESENVQLKSEVAHVRKELQRAQPSGFVEHGGLLWKPAADGFEPRPYCPECATHPVMGPFPPIGRKMYWACPANHTFDYAIRPPKA